MSLYPVIQSNNCESDYKRRQERSKLSTCKLSSFITIKHPQKVKYCLKCHKSKEIEKLIIRR